MAAEERESRAKKADPVPEQEAKPHHVVTHLSSQEADRKEGRPAGGFWGRLMVLSPER